MFWKIVSIIGFLLLIGIVVLVALAVRDYEEELEIRRKLFDE